ncbi:MAG TPA: hypothetical protein VG984_03075 [Candidatus Paceibacterota bacterium]|nr:hypothetical protein [Candidatus Paceibacterota bacterium]
MTEKITLRVFWTMMILCAVSGLGGIWFENSFPEKLIPTFFIIGFANFLIWAPLTLYRLFDK